MEIKTTQLKRCDLIALTGRFDSAAAPALNDALREANERGSYRIVLDMSGVEYFGSAAIRALVVAYKACRRFNRGDVRLAAVPDKVRQVFDLTGLTPLIGIYDDVVTAVGSF
ncbi:MAG: STAS domain-containing protein [Chloroflexi bacterium]|nr:STAS domain-containing protein [Chloroflexota bacterium]